MLDSLLDRLSGSLKKPLPAPPPTSHPVTRPNFVLTYEQKDITASVEPYLLSFSYTDYLGEQSDELQLHFEDVDGRWLRTWFPEQGDKLSIGCGDQFTGLINWGSFELAEIEWQRNMQGGDVVSLKALSTGISHANRTLQPKAYSPFQAISSPSKSSASRNTKSAMWNFSRGWRGSMGIRLRLWTKNWCLPATMRSRSRKRCW